MLYLNRLNNSFSLSKSDSNTSHTPKCFLNPYRVTPLSFLLFYFLNIYLTCTVYIKPISDDYPSLSFLLVYQNERSENVNTKRADD